MEINNPKQAVLSIEYACPKTKELIVVELTGFSFTVTSDECELCGSHGDVTVDFNCPSCQGWHEYQIKSW